MKDFIKYGTTIGLTAAGVVLAGYAMTKLSGEVPFLKTAQNGFQGVF